MSSVTLSIEAVIEQAIERAFHKHLEQLLVITKPKLHDIDPVRTRRESAKILNVAESTMAIWASQKRGPRMIKIGNMVRYRQSELDAFLTENAGFVGRKGRPPKRLVEVHTSGRVGRFADGREDGARQYSLDKKPIVKENAQAEN